MRRVDRSSVDWFRLRKVLSVVVWLFLPTALLIGSRSLLQDTWFRARPFNNSYDAMLIAAMTGIGLTSAWALFVSRRSNPWGFEGSRLPSHFSWWNAFDLFELMLCASLAVTNYITGVFGSALAWLLAFFMLFGLSIAVAWEQKDLVLEGHSRRRTWTLPMSMLLLALGGILIFFPVLQSWSGPPEPFVRWHPFSAPAELIWRGVFLGFAFGMFVAAFDPFGRHSFFLVALVLSGYLHAMEMAADNLSSAHMGYPNGNHEHLYGDIAGWFAIASISLLFLVIDRRHECAERAASLIRETDADFSRPDN